MSEKKYNVYVRVENTYTVPVVADCITNALKAGIKKVKDGKAGIPVHSETSSLISEACFANGQVVRIDTMDSNGPTNSSYDANYLADCETELHRGLYEACLGVGQASLTAKDPNGLVLSTITATDMSDS